MTQGIADPATPQRPLYLQRLGMAIARALAKTPVTPNMVTAVSLIAGVGGAYAFAHGPGPGAIIGAALFSFARILDYVDGSLARLQGKTTRIGYYLDYFTGGISYVCLFLGIGIGLSGGTSLGVWALILGTIAAAVAAIAVFLNMDIDRMSSSLDDDCAGYPQFGGFALEDGIHILVPITWAGLLAPFFVLATLSAAIYGIWTLVKVVRMRSAGRQSS
ncbi:MAG: CDP-alcohol phosphatidyltransferase family protein [Alphaproteobacteria bacterium]|nr:CDP-alcohol phosphatidyltransferase family protein [Alphaproteobacteria bacterium]